MKKLFYLLAICTLIFSSSCKKKTESCNLPSTNVPFDMVDDWISGYTSLTQVVDAYNGEILGTTWRSGNYLKLTFNGKNAELYIFAGGSYAESATKLEGTVTIDEEEETLQFHVCSGHFKGWSNGQLVTDRSSTKAENEQRTENFQFRYFFEESGGIEYLRLQFLNTPNGTPTSFRRAD